MSHDSSPLNSHSPSFVISAGTQVVLKVSKKLEDSTEVRNPGTVGIISKCPCRADGPYRVEFADGNSVFAFFEELALRRKEVDAELAKTPEDLRQYIIYRCFVGSRAFGLSTVDSDDDVRGIFLPPARLHWSLYSLPEQIERLDETDDEVFWEIEKFVRLCLKANPNVLEVLWTPMVIEANEIARELLSLRHAFLSKHLYKTYSGYVLSQFRRMKNSVEKTGEFKTKHAMHLIRLLLSGIDALKNNEIMVDVGVHRDELLEIRAGKLSFGQIEKRALELDREFQSEFEKTTLPEQPDFALVDAFLIRARRSVLDL